MVFSRKTANPSATFSPADIDEYERAYPRRGCLPGILGYFRAVLEDMEQNREFAGRRLMTPVLALGGDVGSALRIPGDGDQRSEVMSITIPK